MNVNHLNTGKDQSARSEASGVLDSQAGKLIDPSVLRLSSSHISREDVNTLKAGDNPGQFVLSLGESSALRQDLSPCLDRIARWAIPSGFETVEFSQDGSTMAIFPVYEDSTIGGVTASVMVDPFADASAETILATVAEVMSDLSRGSRGDGPMWEARSLQMLGAVLGALVELREMGELELSVEAVREYLPLEMVFELSQREDLPERVLAAIKTSLSHLPRFAEKEAMSGNFHRAAREQHSYETMQPVRAFDYLSDIYGDAPGVY